MKQNKLWMGFEIQTSSGPVLQPTRVHFWQDHQFRSAQPEAPFRYKADALLGLSLLHLNPALQKNHLGAQHIPATFADQAWLSLEPHHELYIRCQSRVQSLQKNFKPTNNSAIQSFEAGWSETLATAVTKQGFDLGELTALIEHIDFMEKNLAQPLLYNFQIRFSKTTEQNLLRLHSLLFNLRALIATDYNAHIQDPTFEAIKVDSISDYLPKSDYVTNDAVLYWKFCQLSKQMPEKVATELARTFVNYSHNATCLIESLPTSFLKSISGEDMADALYLTQMDWLLGTDAGLLFRVREELYGLLEGYEKIFWTDLEGKAHQPAHSLSVNCQVTESDLNPTAAAA